MLLLQRGMLKPHGVYATLPWIGVSGAVGPIGRAQNQTLHSFSPDVTSWMLTRPAQDFVFICLNVIMTTLHGNTNFFTESQTSLQVSNPMAPYIAGGHANRCPLFMKINPALTLQPWHRSPAQDSHVSPVPAAQRTQATHHGVGAELGFS